MKDKGDHKTVPPFRDRLFVSILHRDLWVRRNYCASGGPHTNPTGQLLVPIMLMKAYSKVE